MKMIKKIALLFVLSYASITAAQAAYEINTLGSNNSIPNTLIESQVDSDTANALLETPYKGFYKISSKVVNKKITFPKINADQSFPDERWTALAKGIASLAEVPAYMTGSRIEPKATAYVAFYSADIEGLDRSKVMRLPTSIEGEPNTVAVLVVKHKSHTKSQNALLGKGDQKGSNLYLFELAL